MLENLAKTILTYLPPPPAESKPAAIAHGKAAYERYLKAVGMSLHNGSTAGVEKLGGCGWQDSVPSNVGELDDAAKCNQL
jgi:hypothetical protein